jgi:hypothetical protein
MLQRAPAVSTNDRSVYQLFAAVAPIFSRSQPEELELLLRSTTLDHRVTAQMLRYRKLAQLRRARVLVRTNRGIYGIAPEYALAFRCLHTVDALWQAAIARAERPAAGDEGNSAQAINGSPARHRAGSST